MPTFEQPGNPEDVTELDASDIEEIKDDEEMELSVEDLIEGDDSPFTPEYKELLSDIKDTEEMIAEAGEGSPDEQFLQEKLDELKAKAAAMTGKPKLTYLKEMDPNSKEYKDIVDAESMVLKSLDIKRGGIEKTGDEKAA